MRFLYIDCLSVGGGGPCCWIECVFVESCRDLGMHLLVKKVEVRNGEDAVNLYPL